MARKQSLEPEGALYVRLPAKAVTKLDRAAEALGVAKKDLIAGLVTRYVDPSNRRALNALGVLSGKPQRGVIEPGEHGPIAGSHTFRPYESSEPVHQQPALEVLTAAQAAELLQVEQPLVLELAEAGKLPGRKLGDAWRFSRAALIAWLASRP
jgi:excisionase family DNA binding protein